MEYLLRTKDVKENNSKGGWKQEADKVPDKGRSPIWKDWNLKIYQHQISNEMEMDKYIQNAVCFETEIPRWLVAGV